MRRIAGWWLWGQCSWIGSGWCEWDGRSLTSAMREGRAGERPDPSRRQCGGRAGERPDPSRQQCGDGRRRAARSLTSAMRGCLRPPAARPGCGCTNSQPAWARADHPTVRGSLPERALWRRRHAFAFDPPYKVLRRLYGAGEKLVASTVEVWCRRMRDTASLCSATSVTTTCLAGPSIRGLGSGSRTRSARRPTRSASGFRPPCQPLVAKQRSLFWG